MIEAGPTAVLTRDPTVHYGFPRMVRAGNGDLLLFYRVGTTHASDDASIGLRVLAGGATTWSDERVIWRAAEGVSAHNPVAVLAPSGQVLLWASWYEYGRNVRSRCRWSRSADHGRTWAPFEVFDPAATGSCYYVTDVIRTSDGLLAGDATFPPSGQGDCHTRIWHSPDGNAWQVRSLLTAPDRNDGDEVGLVETEPGRILSVHRDRRRADTWRYWSLDGGRSWSRRESIRAALDCVLQRPFLTSLGDGLLLLTGRDHERRMVVGYLSTDAGHTFGQRHVLDTFQQDGGYTAAVSTGPGRCLLVWYSDSHTAPLKPDLKLAEITCR